MGFVESAYYIFWTSREAEDDSDTSDSEYSTEKTFYFILDSHR